MKKEEWLDARVGDSQYREESGTAASNMLASALRKARTFIEYARYELEPGKAQIGDQFPRQEDADAVVGLISEALEGRRQRIVCLCGSTRFIEQFATATWALERDEGAIVLGCTLLPVWFCGVPSHFGEATGTKQQCDDHHKRKIDIADEVLVLDIGGYIGESTRSEIVYARAHGKLIRFVSDDAALLIKILPPPTALSPVAREVESEP